MVSFTVVKLGLAELSYSQQWSKSEYSSSLQLLGCCKRVLFSISFMTSWFLIPWNGLLPYDRISHTHIPELKCFLYILFFKKNSRLLTLNYLPYIQTSEWDVNFLKFIDYRKDISFKTHTFFILHSPTSPQTNQKMK